MCRILFIPVGVFYLRRETMQLYLFIGSKHIRTKKNYFRQYGNISHPPMSHWGIGFAFGTKKNFFKLMALGRAQMRADKPTRPQEFFLFLKHIDSLFSIFNFLCRQTLSQITKR